jgi:ERCC4-related helicase
MKVKTNLGWGVVTRMDICVDGVVVVMDETQADIDRHVKDVDEQIVNIALPRKKNSIDDLRYDAAKSILLAKINSGCSWTMAEVVSMADELVSKLKDYGSKN